MYRLRQGSLLPARAGPLSCAGLAPRLPVWQRPRGGCRKVCSSKSACALLGGKWGPGNGRMRASAPTRVMGPGIEVDTGPPLMPSRRGRRPRRPASTSWPAPAERERKGIRALPGLEDSPGASRLMEVITRKVQPSLAGGMEVRALRGPTRRSDFFSWTVHCAAVGGFAAYGCGVPLAGAARLSPA